MVERQLDWRRYGIWAAALATGGLLFWIALHCDGADWFISQTHADIIYTGLRRFREFPFFSFVFNGGSYFVQDPQSNLFSAAVPLILLAGPTVGLRLLEGLWGVCGVIAFTAWMRRRVSAEAALVGGVAIATSLGVLWKIAVGNDMFLWHLGLPALLWAVERVMKERTLRSALVFGLALGVLLLGPTFHSFTYLFVPVVPIFVLVEWAFERPTRRQFLETVGLFALSCVLALSIISFKLACWAKFPMTRQVGDFGSIPFWTGVRNLFDYGIVQTAVVQPTRYVGKSLHWLNRGWGVEETAHALPPLATLLALVGIALAGFSPARRKTGLFALILVVTGLTLSCSSTAWEAFRLLNGGNFRVAQRCLGMAAFGLAIFCALGADVIFARFPRAAWPAAGVAVLILLGSGVWWTRSASHFLGTMANDTVSPTAMNPVQVFQEEWAAVDQIDSYTHIRRYRGERDILSGTGYSDGFLVVGNDFRPDLWVAQRKLPVWFDANWMNERGFKMLKPDQVSFENVRIKLRRLRAHGRYLLRANVPKFGMIVKTTPPDAKIAVEPWGNLLLVENKGDEEVERVVIRAEFPVSAVWIFLSLAAFFGTIISLIELRERQVASAPAATLGSEA